MATFHAASEIHAYLNECEFGQQAAVFGTDHAEIASLIDVLVNVVCRVNINSQCQRGPDFFPFTYTTATTPAAAALTPSTPIDSSPLRVCVWVCVCVCAWMVCSGRKNSAAGTLSVHDALRVFSIRSMIACRETPSNTSILNSITRNSESNFLRLDHIF